MKYLLAIMFTVALQSCQPNSNDKKDKLSEEVEEVAEQSPPAIEKEASPFANKKIDKEVLSKVLKPYNIESYYLMLAKDYDEAAAVLMRKEEEDRAYLKYYVEKLNVRGGYLKTYLMGEGASMLEEVVQWNLKNGGVLVGYNKVIDDYNIDSFNTEVFGFYLFTESEWKAYDTGILTSMHGKSNRELTQSALLKELFPDPNTYESSSLRYHLQLPEKGKDIKLTFIQGDGDVLKEVALKWNDGQFEL